VAEPGSVLAAREPAIRLGASVRGGTAPRRDRQSAIAVVRRLRGHTDLGTTLIDVVARYPAQLDEAGSRVVTVSVDTRVMPQLAVGGVIDVIAPDSVVVGDERVGAALARAVADARQWIDADPVGPATA